MKHQYHTVIYQDHGGSHPHWWYYHIDIHRSQKLAQEGADDLTRRNSHRPFVTEVLPGRGHEARSECALRNKRIKGGTL